MFNYTCQNFIPIDLSPITLLLFVIFIVAMIFKGMALWHAARVGSTGWFVALLIVNTLGILDLIYLYIISRKNQTISPTSASE